VYVKVLVDCGPVYRPVPVMVVPFTIAVQVSPLAPPVKLTALPLTEPVTVSMPNMEVSQMRTEEVRLSLRVSVPPRAVPVWVKLQDICPLNTHMSPKMEE